MSGDGHDYSQYGTQEEQAAKQASVGAEHVTDGPWRLERWTIADGKPKRVVLPNSVRSSMSEAIALREAEEARTDIVWGIAKLDREEK